MSFCRNSLLFTKISRNLRVNSFQILSVNKFNRPKINTSLYRFVSNINDNNKFPASEEKYKETLPNYSSLLDTYLPSKLVPYALLARLDKPIGTWLLYLPCTWSITMATYHTQLAVSQTIYTLALFGVGAFIMRGAGCTINDMWDRKIDSKVERTANRPLASGVVNPFQALTFLGIQLSAGLAVLTQFNWYSIFLGATSLSIVTIYPFMKRVTFWPQLYLGLAFNWGALLGWPAMIGSSEWSVTLPLYTAGVCWTLIYDTIYAHQDKKFDSLVGVKSTALLFGDKTRHWLTLFSGSMLSFLILAGYMNGNDYPYYIISVMGAGSHLAWQLRTVNFDDVSDCGRKFRSNKWTGAMVLSGIVADIIWKNLNSVN
ncbi:18931_t:CDS:2 [Funneliformis geosporum]|uniref:4-hydroxybenzoate polyprenyltransferase, mitochondrial n=1 Tax=Funneliformis geosporum TaxID=1117311 RepID=A0A9W4SKQ2_9GLOM|nr:16294_t:CDS:2 [Funneliformis geosporum]CAI2175877.1 18931_t:CDS:2 [Funneliformis geosporum]